MYWKIFRDTLAPTHSMPLTHTPYKLWQPKMLTDIVKCSLGMGGMCPQLRNLVLKRWGFVSIHSTCPSKTSLEALLYVLLSGMQAVRAATIWIFAGLGGRGEKSGCTKCTSALKTFARNWHFTSAVVNLVKANHMDIQRELESVLCAWKTWSQLYRWSEILTLQYYSKICFNV